MSKEEARVEELVNKIERGEIRLPEMQRRYVWRSTRVRDLLDSLYRGYPSGAILLWETDEDVPLQEMAIEQQDTKYRTTRLLLDGQQRLTSLSAVIRGEPVTVRGRKRPIELLFNLEHPENTFVMEVNEDSDEDEIDDEVDSTEDELLKRFEKMTFVVMTKKLAQLPQWVKVSDVFSEKNDTKFLKEAGVVSFDDPLFEKYSHRLAKLRGIKDYVYRMDVLHREMSYEEVTEIFVRVNSLGAKLRSSDLALAQITAKWRDSLQEFLRYQNKCNERGFHLDLSILLKMMVTIATGQTKFQTVGSIPLDRLQQAWKEATGALDYAINFTKSNTGIDSPALLSSPFLLITIAYYGYKRDYQIGAEESRSLAYYVLIANAKGRYSRGSSEGILNQDIATLRDGKGLTELLSRLRQQVGRLDIVPNELKGRNQRSSLFKTMFLAFRAAGAIDWRSGLNISLSHAGSEHKLQFHHFFPKKVLKGIYTIGQINDIANLTFIGGKTNRRILDKEPIRYIGELLEKNDESVFEKQCVPLDKETLVAGEYEQFLEKRRGLIAVRLNDFINSFKTPLIREILTETNSIIESENE